MEIGDKVRVKKCRDTPAALGDQIAEVILIDSLSVWVTLDGLTYVLDRSQMKRVKPPMCRD